MKKIAIKIMLVCLSAVVFTTGMGTTVANFCCDDCLENFFSGQTCKIHDTFVVAERSCCAKKTAKQDKNHEKCKNEATGNTDKDCCDAQRLSVDIDSFHFKPQIVNSYVWISNVIGEAAQSVVLDTYAFDFYPQIKAPPKILSPRDYLSFIRILVI